jgi:hypothetical protein
MLNLSFIFDDAIHALKEYSDCLAVVPLPAAVYMMQVDVINHYQYALDHYLTLTLDQVENSPRRTRYQKWAYFTNEDFTMLSFAIHNLLRYTSRLVYETEWVAWNNRPWSYEEEQKLPAMKRKSNSYTDPICEIRHRNKSIGVTIHDDYRLSIVAVRTEWSGERVRARSTPGGPTLYFRVTSDANGYEHEQAIGRDEYQRVTESIRAETIDIRDRSRLAPLKERGQVEIARLKDRNYIFEELCNAFYQSRRVAEPFENLNEVCWI